MTGIANALVFPVKYWNKWCSSEWFYVSWQGIC